MKNWIPNCLTFFRIILIPVLVVFYFSDVQARGTIVAGIFIIAAVTDMLDGFLARYLNATTPLGAFLDPVADKLVVSSALVLLVSDLSVLAEVFSPVIFSVATCIIIGREIVISALREWMAEMGERGLITVQSVGKLKTAFQMIAIACLLYAQSIHGLPIFKIGEVIFYIAALLTLWSMWIYLSAAKPFLLNRTNN